METCVKMKRDIVNEDEFDTGLRQLLNLGHTLGHSIEKNSNFTLSHGHAVAIGMHLIAKVAERRGLAEKGLAETIRRHFCTTNLPTSTSYTAEEIAAGVFEGQKTQRRRNQLYPSDENRALRNRENPDGGSVGFSQNGIGVKAV